MAKRKAKKERVRKKLEQVRKPSGRVVCWVTVPGTYIGKQYVRGEIADFGHFIEAEKLQQLKRTGHLEAVEDVALIETCPRCEARFINRKVREREDRDRKVRDREGRDLED